jgi:nucleoside-diphosphate kinase
MIEKTLAILKPNVTRDKNVGKIIDRIEQESFKISALRQEQLTKEKAEQFYDIHKGKHFFDELIQFMTSGPVVLLALEKENAISEWRTLMGATNPEEAAENTLRKLYAASFTENATHGSDSPENAKKELAFFFPKLET